MSSSILTNPYLIAMGIPCLLLLCGALAKKIVRGPGWQRKDFFLGVEFTLAAMSSALVYVFDLVKLLSASPNASAELMTKLTATSVFMAVTFFLLLTVLSVHQDWELQNDKPRTQFFWLAIFSNLIGFGLIASFVLLVKGVD